LKKNTFILRASGSQFTCAPHNIYKYFVMYRVYSLNSQSIRFSWSTENWMDLSGATTKAPFT
jgi:hypothetical protein